MKQKLNYQDILIGEDYKRFKKESIKEMYFRLLKESCQINQTRVILIISFIYFFYILFVFIIEEIFIDSPTLIMVRATYVLLIFVISLNLIYYFLKSNKQEQQIRISKFQNKLLFKTYIELKKLNARGIKKW